MGSSGGDRVLLTEFSLDRRRVLEWTTVGTGTTILATFVFAALYSLGTGSESADVRVDSLDTAVVGFVLLVLFVVAVIVVHEAIHAALLRHFGGDVSYGFGLAGFVLPYAYVTTTHRTTGELEDHLTELEWTE